MSVRAMMVAMAAGTAAVIFFAHRPASQPAALPPERPAEPAWLSREATAQLVTPEGRPGPLFAGLRLGGPPPSAAARERVAEFARKNHVDIDLDVHFDELSAIRLGVTYRGGFGYEGAEVLALRLRRPQIGNCGGPRVWADNWTLARDDGTHLRGHIDVNRVEVRWENTATLADVVGQADRLLGADLATVRLLEPYRWVDLDHKGVYRYEMALPEPAESSSYGAQAQPRSFGLRVLADSGQVVEVSLDYLGFDFGEVEDLTSKRHDVVEDHEDSYNRLTFYAPGRPRARPIPTRD